MVDEGEEDNFIGFARQFLAKESFEIATKIAYRNGGPIGIPKGGNRDCTMEAAAPVLPAG